MTQGKIHTKPEKLDEKALKRPDQFQRWGVHILSNLRQYSRQMVLILIPILALAVAGFGWQFYTASKEEKRRAALAKIATKYSEESELVAKQQEEFQKQITALRSPADPKGDGKGKKTPTAEDLLKIAALEKQRDGIKADHKVSLEQFKVFYQDNKNNAEGWLAGLNAAKGFLDEGKLQEAQPLLGEIVKASVAQKFYQTHGRLLLAAVLEDLKQYDGALQELETLTGLVGDDVLPQVLLAKGRVYLEKDAKNEAKGAFNQIIEKHGSSPEAQKARSILALAGLG